MRIGMYLSHFPAPGGTTNAVGGLAVGLANMGHTIVVLAQAVEASTYAYRDVVTLRTFERPRIQIPFMVSRKLLAYIVTNTDSLDLLILNGIFNPDLPLLSMAAKSAGIPYVVCPHNQYSDVSFQRNRMRKQIYWVLVEKQMLCHSAAIQVHVDEYISDLKERNVNSSVIVVPNGIGRQQLVQLRGMQKRREDGKTVVGFLGRIDSWTKGLDMLVDAIALIDADEHRVVLRLVGPDNSSVGELKGQAERLGIGNSVQFCGSVGSAFEAFSQFDMVALPSRHDSYGFVVLEAMAAGLPLLVSTGVGSSPVVKASESGVICAPTIEGIAKGIRELISRQDEWERMGQRGRAYVFENLTWDKIAAKALEDYERVLANA